MFPTFTHLISRHPKRFSLFGLLFFVFGTFLWYINGVPVTVTQVTHITQDNQSQHTEADVLQEQFAMLDSLKNKNNDTTSLEEKFETLNQLAGNGPNTFSLEEQEQLLERLK